MLAEVLKHEGVPETPNLRMHFRKDVLTLVDYISNFVDVDREGFVVGFKPPLIHVFNKVGDVGDRCLQERPANILTDMPRMRRRWLGPRISDKWPSVRT